MSEYGQESMWRDTAAAHAERARDLAARLERRAKADDEVAARDTYLGLLDIAAGSTRDASSGVCRDSRLLHSRIRSFREFAPKQA